MKDEQINREIYPSGTPVACNWLKVKDVLANYPLKLTKLYELMHQRKIRSFVLKDHPGAIRGMRLIDKRSLDIFFERAALEAEEEQPRG
jgi:hypothetical protein